LNDWVHLVVGTSPKTPYELSLGINPKFDELS
jgi:hypothetical protein